MRVVLANDSRLLRQSLASALTQVGVDVVAQAGDAEELLQAVEHAVPDVAVIDVRMPPTHTDEGVRAARELRRRYPGVGVLVLSQHLQARYALEMVTENEERVGYLLKDRVANIAELVDAMERVARGETVVDPEIVRRLLRRRVGGSLEEITDREREVLALMAEGRTNQGIAEQLTVSVRTVESHVAHILTKLGIEATSRGHPRVLAVLRYLGE